MSVLKTLISSVACLLLFTTYSADLVTVSGVIVFIIGGISARYHLETTATIRGISLAVGIWFFGFYGLSVFTSDTAAMGEIATYLGLSNGKHLLLFSDVLLFIGIGGSLGFALRFLGLRYRFGNIAEVIFAVSSGAIILLQHRHNALDRPRFLADWALIQGIEPYDLILAIGVAAAFFIMILTLRHRFIGSLILGVLLLSMIGSAAYWLRDDVPLMEMLDPNQGGQANGAQDRLNSEQPPKPIAVALLHTDFTPPKPILYFRQQVLSFYDGFRFSTETSPRYDTDVIQRYPGKEPTRVDHVDMPGYRTPINISMFLLENHPQPFALSNSVEVRSIKNPSPRRFVAAYDSVSHALNVPDKRLLGRASIPADWSEEKRAHYLARSSDPRYESLAQELAEETDLRHYGDPMLRAFAVKQYLEKNGFYSLKEKHVGAKDPAASFLFGNFRGYCVHFAHAAVQLLRSLDVAARVALGYAVDLRARGDGTSLIIMANTAHAWPEIHIEGIGWIPFDIYPEQSDEPPPSLVQPSLESLLGDLARDDPSKTAYQVAAKRRWQDTIKTLLVALSSLLSFVLLGLYAIRYGRHFYLSRASASTQEQYRMLLDELGSFGFRRRRSETRVDFASRLQSVCPSLGSLTHDYQAYTFGRHKAPPSNTFIRGLNASRNELKMHLPLHRRFIGRLNPISWWGTR